MFSLNANSFNFVIQLFKEFVKYDPNNAFWIEVLQPVIKAQYIYVEQHTGWQLATLP